MVLEVRHEAVVKVFEDPLVGLELKVSHAGINHQVDQVEDVGPLVTQVLESLNKLRLECLVVMSLEPAHWSNHRLVDPDLRAQFLLEIVWLLSKNESEIDVEEDTILGDHQVFQMPISDSENVSGHALPSA